MIDPRIQAALDGPHGSRPQVERVKRREGYAAAPGSGPFGEKCSTCRHIGGVRGNEYTSICRVGKRGPYGALLYISPGADACQRWEAR